MTLQVPGWHWGGGGSVRSLYTPDIQGTSPLGDAGVYEGQTLLCKISDWNRKLSCEVALFNNLSKKKNLLCYALFSSALCHL